jgi:hypothetical protein
VQASLVPSIEGTIIVTAPFSSLRCYLKVPLSSTIEILMGVLGFKTVLEGQIYFCIFPSLININDVVYTSFI